MLVVDPGSAVSQVQTSPSSAFLQSLAQLTLVGSPQLADSSHGLLLPSAQFRTEGPLPRQASTLAYVPPSGFGYPLGGFLPSIPSESCFVLTALVGFSPSKHHLRARFYDVSVAQGPHVVTLASYAANMTVTRRRKPRLLGFDPRPKPKTASTRGTVSPDSFLGVLPF
jgi:hypothetical protein